jgi:hypothetical protein
MASVAPAERELASLTGFAPVISCMRGRRVGWTTPQGQKWLGQNDSRPVGCAVDIHGLHWLNSLSSAD